MGSEQVIAMVLGSLLKFNRGYALANFRSCEMCGPADAETVDKDPQKAPL